MYLVRKLNLKTDLPTEDHFRLEEDDKNACGANDPQTLGLNFTTFLVSNILFVQLMDKQFLYFIGI